MLYLRKALCIFLITLFLVQPVFAETQPAQTAETDIVTAVHRVQTLPSGHTSGVPETEEQQWLYRLITAPLYLMENTGNWSPVLAGALPEDVTADYAGTYGIPAGEQRGYAFRIPVHEKACWADGTKITADDCLASIRQLLENKDTAEHWTCLANAKAILSGEAQPGSEIVSLKSMGFPGISEAWSAGYRDFYVDTDGFWGLNGGWKPISDRNRLRDFAMPGGLDEYFVTPAYLYRNYLMTGAQSSYYQYEFIGICEAPGEALTMENLGAVKVNESEFVLILEEPSTASMLMQRLEALYLFRDSASYGPYHIVNITDDQIVLELNPNWWGAPDPRGYGRIICQKIGT